MFLTGLGQSWKQQFIAVLIGGFGALFPVILFVDRYIDDFSRSIRGHLNWVSVGRPLADEVFSLVNFGRPAVAVAPLHTVLAIVLLAFAGLMFARAYGLRSPFWSAVVVLPLLAQPYGLENLSYGFDSFFMALSVSLSILSALVVQAGGGATSFVVAVLMLVSALSLYQPGANGFIPVAGFLVISGELRLLSGALSEMLLRMRLLRTFSALSAALIVYKAITMIYQGEMSGYAEAAGELVKYQDIFSGGFVHTFFEPWLIAWGDFGHGLICLPIIFLVLTYCFLIFNCVPFLRGVVLIVSAVLIALGSPGPLLFLKSSMFGVPRVMLFFGPLVMAIAVQVIALSRKPIRLMNAKISIYLARASVLIFGWLLIVFSYAYGHAFSAQSDFERLKITQLITAVSSFQARDPYEKFDFIAIDGQMPSSPVLVNTSKKFPLIDRLVPRLIDNNWSHGRHQLSLSGLHLEGSKWNEEAEESLPSCFSSQAMCRNDFQLFRINTNTLLMRLLPVELTIKP